LLVDSNLLLLGVVGNFDYRLIGRKRLEKFSVQDLQVLNLLTSWAKQLITTPGILTETSNLAAQMIDEPRRSQLFESFRFQIRGLNEHYEKSTVVCEQPAFLRFGLTDAAIAQIARDDMAVLTADYRLCGYLTRIGVMAMNFYHYRAEK
jgi:hypothetical protein